MTQLNTIFTANLNDVLANNTHNFQQVFEFKTITDLDISNLWAIVNDEEFDFDKHELLPLEIDDSDDNEIFELPETFLARLAQYSVDDLATISEKWAGTEELQTEPSALLPIVEHLYQLAKKGKSVYFSQEM